MNCLKRFLAKICPFHNMYFQYKNTKIEKDLPTIIDDISDKQYILIKNTQHDPHVFMHEQMKKVLLPYCINTFKSHDVDTYYEGRNMKNTRIIQVMENELLNLKKIFGLLKETYNYTININNQDEITEEHIININYDYIKNIIPMSSLCAGLNLITESDVDFGLLIQDLNTPTHTLDYDKFNTVKEILLNNGYIYSMAFNETNYKNRYFSFIKYKDDIEIEIKVRDYDTALSLVKLHHILDNNLSETQKKYYTYMKYICKNLDKTNKGYKYYAKIKKIIYEAHWVGIENAFVFPRVCDSYEKYSNRNF